MDHGSWHSRVADGAKWFALTTAFSVVMTAGGFLLMTPVMYVAVPEFDLAARKLATSLGGTTVVMVVGLFLVLAGTALRKMAFRIRQAKNDRVASQILGDLRLNPEAPVPAFYLYLRAFETTGRLHVPLFLRLRKLSTGMTSLDTNDVESHLSGAIRRVGPLIALGHPGEAFGAGRVSTDDASWTADIRTLMAHARGILLVPSHRPGTMWEIETLKREGWLTKTIFVMPPRAVGELDTKQRWEVARQALAAHGLDAPDHEGRGLLFEVGSDGRVSNVEPMLLTSVKQMRKSLNRLLSDDPPSGGLFKAIARAERRARRATLWGWSETARELSPYGLALVGLFMWHPAVGFNPQESWATVLNRVMSARGMSERESVEEMVLSNSGPYQALVAQTNDVAALRGRLLLRGLARISDAGRRDYFEALGGMVASLDTATCAAFGKGQLSDQQWQIAFTYIPWTKVEDFLRARRQAIQAAAEDQPVAPVNEKAVAEVEERLEAYLGPSGLQRFILEDSPDKRVSDDDVCWRVRQTYGAVTKLPEPYGTAWAQQLAVQMSGETSTANRELQPVKPDESRAQLQLRPSNELPEPARPPQLAHAGGQPNLNSTIERKQPSAQIEPPPGAVRSNASLPETTQEPRAEPSYRPPGGPSIVGSSYPFLLDEARAAIGARRMPEARDVVEQMIRLDPSKNEAWELRGMLAMNVYGDLPVAYESYGNALARGGKATFRIVHDHGPDRPPCFGGLEIGTADVEFRSDDGGHRFLWPLDTIREAGINNLYGSALGMFHIKAQTPTQKSGDTFNFLVMRATDQQIVNRRADAVMILRLLSQLRSGGK